jgi:hypothetical protein
VHGEREGTGPHLFEAVEPDGTQLVLSGALFAIAVRSQRHDLALVTYDYNGPGLQLTNDSAQSTRLTVRFRLFNLRFSGNVSTQSALPDGGYRLGRDTLSLSLQGRALSIVQLDKYDAITRRLTSKQEECAVTCEALCSVEEPAGLVECEAWMDLVCSLLSLAAGTKVSWASYKAFNVDNSLARQVHRAAVLGRFSSASLLSLDDPQSLRSYLESAATQANAPGQFLELRKAIDAKMDAQVGGYLETRALMASVLAEYLASAYAASRRRTCRSFGERLQFVARELRLPFRGKDIQKLNNTRDSLAHELRFRTDNRRAEYWRVMHFVDCVLLRSLGFSGHYISRETRQLQSLPPLTTS